MMRQYSEKTDGAFIEEKESMIVWNYKDSDHDLGKWQAKELTSQIRHVFSSLQMEVIQGKTELYVVPKQLTRRKVLKKTIKLAGNREPVDFILYIADDPYNEKVFSYLNTLQSQELAKKLDSNLKMYSCTIGRRVTEANYFLNSIDSVLKLLQKLP